MSSTSASLSASAARPKSSEHRSSLRSAPPGTNADTLRRYLEEMPSSVEDMGLEALKNAGKVVSPKKTIASTTKGAVRKEDVPDQRSSALPPVEVGSRPAQTSDTLTITKTYTTHYVTIIYTFGFIRMLAPIRAAGTGRSRRAQNLGLVERFCKKRPQMCFQNVLHYILHNTGKKFEQELPLEPMDNDHNILPTSPKDHLYTYGNNDYVLVEYSREVNCRVCQKAVPRLNGMTCARVNTNTFRGCCSLRESVFATQDTTPNLKSADMLFKIYYDIESTKAEPTAPHEFYLAVIITISGRAEVVRTPAQFMDVIGQDIRFAAARSAGRTAQVQLISFNGSRYDDLFLTEEWKKYILKAWGIEALRRCGYSERKRAITHNTLSLFENQFRVVWTDLLRFVPPTSLRKLAKDFGLENKGFMPFEVLDDYRNRGGRVKRDDDGFFARCYFARDDDREECKKYYELTLSPPERASSQDVDILCARYCELDTRLLVDIYARLEHRFITYLSPLLGTTDWQPLTLHSLSTLSARVMVHTAMKHPSWNYNSTTGETAVSPVPVFLAPRGILYDYFRLSISGGWTKAYHQGFLLDTDGLPRLIHGILEEFFQDKAIFRTPHEMYDIASMYPVAVTFPMPVGAGRWVIDIVEQTQLMAQLLTTCDVVRIPLFFARASLQAPSKPQFFESTLPQKNEKTNGVRWTYWDDYSETRVYNSLDLWIACRDHTNAGPDGCYKVVALKDMYFFPCGAQCYAPFMQQCAKGKHDGTVEGDTQKRTTFKIAMNAAIGKLGQNVESQHNIVGAGPAAKFVERHQDVHSISLIGTREVNYTGGVRTFADRELIFKLKDNDLNNWYPHHASYMYAATRKMRLDWSLHTRAYNTDILSMPHPDTFYGDTDSKIQATTHSSRMPVGYIGDTVGWFRTEGTDDLSLLTRPFFQIEAEPVSQAPLKARVSGILGPKKYFVWASNDDCSKTYLKFKCNGLTQFDVARTPCPFHSVVRCELCQCPHKTHVVMCLICVAKLLVDESFDGDDAVGTWRQKTYKYSTISLRALTLLDFVRVLATGRTCVAVRDLFDRVLSIATSKLSEYSIVTVPRTISLNRPRLLDTLDEMLQDRKLDHADRGSAFVSGLVRLPGHPVGLYPSGTYLRSILAPPPLPQPPPPAAGE